MNYADRRRVQASGVGKQTRPPNSAAIGQESGDQSGLTLGGCSLLQAPDQTGIVSPSSQTGSPETRLAGSPKNRLVGRRSERRDSGGEAGGSHQSHDLGEISAGMTGIRYSLQDLNHHWF